MFAFVLRAEKLQSYFEIDDHFYGRSVLFVLKVMCINKHTS
jgi:hypothetical protein